MHGSEDSSQEESPGSGTVPECGHLILDEDDRSAKRHAMELLEKDRLALLSLRPFIGSLSMGLKIVPVVDARCITACTDGRSVFFNAYWACNMDDARRMAVLATRSGIAGSSTSSGRRGAWKTTAFGTTR